MTVNGATMGVSWAEVSQMDGCDDDGVSCIENGRACTADPDLARRAFNAKITPASGLAEDPYDWPRNVFIANEALSSDGLENILAGVGYIDDVERESLMSVWQWFPALCAEKPLDSDLSYMENCRWEFVAITLMALSGEMEE